MGGEATVTVHADCRDSGNSKGKRILVADDEPLTVRYVTRVLTRAGFDVLTVSDPASLPLAAAAENVDLVLVDPWMAGVDGLLLLEDLRALAKAPFLVFSAEANPAFRERALALGACDYIIEPIPLVELLQRIHAALELGPRPAPKSADF